MCQRITDFELAQRNASSAQVAEYAMPVDRNSAREMLAVRSAAVAESAVEVATGAAPSAARARASRVPPTALEQVLKSPIARTVAGAVTRGIMGALLGGMTRRRRR